jgi:hypothetical protein
MQALTKEKTAAVNFVANLEKQYDWIPDERVCFASLFRLFIYLNCVDCVVDCLARRGPRMISRLLILAG